MDCCQPTGRKMRHHAHSRTICCCVPGHHTRGFHRRFVSKKERIEFLKEYERELKNEIEGVNEKIAKLEKK